MSISQVAAAILTASITSASVFTVVYIYILERIPKLDENGIPIEPYENFAGWLVLVILLGVTTTVSSLIVLLLNADIRLSLMDPQSDATLLAIAFVLYVLEAASITVGIIMIHRKETG
jgi:hypothetical protein